MPRIILASASPQRRQLLAGLGVSFTVEPSGVDEEKCMEREPRTRALKLAEAKAGDVYAKYGDAVVIGCDTLVVGPDGSLLEKPADAADARRMLALQSGGRSTVHSGLALIDHAGRMASDVSSSSVDFRTLSDADLDWWIAGGQWADRSGAFQIDGAGQLLIERMEGDWTGVVGLPVFLLGRLAGRLGVQLQGETIR